MQLAINMLDESDFRLGQKLATGPMRVREAEASYKSQKDQPLKSDEAKKKGTSANRDRNKVIQKTQEMNKYVSTPPTETVCHQSSRGRSRTSSRAVQCHGDPY